MKFKECHCDYCDAVGSYPGFPAVWRLRTNQLWIEVPKNASTFMKKVFFDMKIEKEYDKNEVPTVILRDPVERFISLVKHYSFDPGPKSAYLHHIYTGNLEDTESLVNSFIDQVFEFDTKVQCHHFYPQTYFFKTLPFDKINFIKMKDISKTFNLSDNDNKKFKNKSSGFIIPTDDQVKKIKEIYQGDYEYYESN